MTLPYKLLAILTAIALTISGLWAWQEMTYKKGYNAGTQYTQHLWDTEKALTAQVAASAQAKANRDSLIIANQQQVILRAAIQQRQTNIDHARGYDAAASSVLELAKHTTSCSDSTTTDHPTAAPGGASSPATTDMRDELLQWYAKTAGELALTADESHSAAVACERSYDSVIETMGR
jgi:hypothetical protein